MEQTRQGRHACLLLLEMLVGQGCHDLKVRQSRSFPLSALQQRLLLSFDQVIKIGPAYWLSVNGDALPQAEYMRAARKHSMRGARMKSLS